MFHLGDKGQPALIGQWSVFDPKMEAATLASASDGKLAGAVRLCCNVRGKTGGLENMQISEVI